MSDRRVVFRRCLNHISQNLSRQHFDEMKFMCKDVIPYARMEKIHGGIDLFQALEERGKLGVDNLEFLIKILTSVGRDSILGELVREGFLPQATIQQVQAGANQTPVRRDPSGGERAREYPFTECLMRIAQRLTHPEVQNLAYVWSEPLLGMSTDKVHSATQLFQLLQQRQIITPSNVRPLYDELHEIGRSDLALLINSYLKKTDQVGYDVPDGGSRPVGQGGIRGRPGGPLNYQSTQPVQASEDPKSVHLRTSPYREGVTTTREGFSYPSMCSDDSEISLQSSTGASGPYVYRPTGINTSSEFSSAQTVSSMGQLSNVTGSYRSSSEHTGLPSSRFPYSNGSVQTNPQILQYSGIHSPPPRSAAFDHTPKFQTSTPYQLTFDSRTESGEPLQGPQAHQGVLAALSLKDTELLAKEQEVEQLREKLRQAQMQARQAQVQPSQHNEAAYVEMVTRLEAIIRIKNKEVAEVTEEMRKIQQSQATVPVDDDELYPMDKHPHGICLIINNHKFYHPTHPERAHNDRGGAEVDQYNLVQTFRYLRYRVEVEENLTHDQMTEKMMKMSQRDHSNYDSFICCILTHGERDVVHGADSIEVNLADLTGLMKFSRTLTGKPKMFFVQACRGDKEDPGVQLDHERDSGGLDTSSVNSVIPSDADFFYGYATPSGSAAYRSKRHGSWYISELCKVFTENAYGSTLGRMMKRVNNLVSKAFTKEGLKQCSENVDRLRKEVHFFHHIRNKVGGRSR